MGNIHVSLTIHRSSKTIPFPNLTFFAGFYQQYVETVLNIMTHFQPIVSWHSTQWLVLPWRALRDLQVMRDFPGFGTFFIQATHFYLAWETLFWRGRKIFSYELFVVWSRLFMQGQLNRLWCLICWGRRSEWLQLEARPIHSKSHPTHHRNHHTVQNFHWPRLEEWSGCPTPLYIIRF